MNPNEKKYNTFSICDYQNVPRFYSLGVSYWLNDMLDEKELQEQISSMSQNGISGICVMGVPQLFRPITINSKLEPDYLSPNFFKYLKCLVKECKKYDMDYWLYDEGGWPSGNAGGLLIQRRPDLVKQGLSAVCKTVEPGETIYIPENAVYALADDVPVSAGDMISAKEKSIVVFLYQVEKAQITNGIVQPDLLNGETAKEFIQITHECYLDAVGEYFGDIITKVFCDEPTAGLRHDCLVWTSDILEEFYKRKNYDLTPFIPYLFFRKTNLYSDSSLELTEEQQKIRIDYYDVWTQLFVERFFLPIQNWCSENGLLFGMHLSGEHETLNAASTSFGHIMRIFRKIDIPGVDVIWRQLFPGRYNHFFPRFASSVTHQRGKRWAFSESFTIFGIGLTPAQRKWLTDYQVVRGINLFATASSYNNYSENACTKVPYKCDNEPMSQYLGDFYSYIKRLCYCMALGSPLIQTAVYYPLKDLWCLGTVAERAKRSLEAVCSMLDNGQYDFDLIDDDIFEDCKVSVQDGCLIVGEMRYTSVIIPLNLHISKKMCEILCNASENGVKVICIQQRPKLLKSNQVAVVDNSHELYSLLSQTVSISPKNSSVRVSYRTLENGELCFITNESLNEISFSVSISSKYKKVYLLDCKNGKIEMPFSGYQNDHVSVDLSLPFAGSALLLITDSMDEILKGSELELIEEVKSEDMVVTALPLNHFTIKPLYKYQARPIFERYEKVKCDNKEQKANLGLWDAMLGDRFCGEAEYRHKINFNLDSLKKAILALGDVRYCCKVIINGRLLEKLLWEPYCVDITDFLINGENEICVVVSNTAANIITDPDTELLWNKKEGPGWVSPYRNISKNFEYENVCGGLFGPVTVIFYQ